MPFHQQTRRVQEKLMRMGYNVGTIDGVAGPITAAAIVAFLVTTGKRQRGFTGPVLTAAGHVRAVYRKYVEKAEPSVGLAPWADHAINQIGTREWAGDKHNPKIIEWFRKIASPWFTTDETPWCAAFVGAMLEEAGIASTKSARARSYENWGEECGDLQGAVVVLSRGRNPAYGHVGFLIAVDERDDKVCVLGGNQGDAVSLDWFDRDRVVSLRWPEGCARPKIAVSMASTGDEPTTD